MAKLQAPPIDALIASLGAEKIAPGKSCHISYYRGGYIEINLTNAFFESCLEYAASLLPLAFSSSMSEDELFSPVFYCAQKLRGGSSCKVALSEPQKRALIRVLLCSYYDLSEAECVFAAKNALACFYKSECSGLISALLYNALR